MSHVFTENIIFFLQLCPNLYIRDSKIDFSAVALGIYHQIGVKVAGQSAKKDPITFFVLQKQFWNDSITASFCFNIKCPVVFKNLSCNRHVGHAAV